MAKYKCKNAFKQTSIVFADSISEAILTYKSLGEAYMPFTVNGPDFKAVIMHEGDSVITDYIPKKGRKR